MAFVSGGALVGGRAGKDVGRVCVGRRGGLFVDVIVRCEADGVGTVEPSKRETVREKKLRANKKKNAPPPSTFYQAVTQAQDATEQAIEAGFQLMEIEFPPLPQDQMDSSAVGAYAVIDANLRLVLDFAKRFADQGKRVCLALPDAEEKDRALEMSNENEEPYPNVRLGALKDGYKGTFLDRLLTTGVEKDVAVREDDDVFIILGASCQELPDVEKFVEKAGKRPVIFFNLKLDTARGDLGLPAFPPKDLHYRFLSQIIPIYYLRTRSYSRSVPQPPYVVNYSGALYRVFPGDYQVLLNAPNGQFERVELMETRPSLGEVRDSMTAAMNLSTDAPPSPLISFLRKGYKSTTWWEDDFEKQESNNWRM